MRRERDAWASVVLPVEVSANGAVVECEEKGRIADVDPQEAMGSVVLMRSFTAVIKKSDDWWIGWIEEVPGVNCQGKTRAELTENLSSALREAIEMHRGEAIAAAEGDYQEQTLVL